MKSLFVTLLILGGAFAAYDYFGAPPGEKVIFKHLNTEAPKAPPPTAATSAEPAAPTPESGPAAPPPVAKAPEQAPTKAPPSSIPTPGTEEAAMPKAEANGFVPPKYDPIETLTNNWAKIPPTAFPREVTLLKATLFKMSVGGSTIAAGAKAVALSLEGSQLTLAPTAASAARAVVPMDETDFKKILSDGYAKWQVTRTDNLRKAYARKLASKDSPAAPAPQIAPAGSIDPTGKPVKSADGTYPMLVAHLKSGEVTELKAENVKSWSDAVSTTHEGKPAWAVKVNADVNTIFGLQPVEAMAVVRDNRVIGWFYTGSGEPVP